MGHNCETMQHPLDDNPVHLQKKVIVFLTSKSSRYQVDGIAQTKWYIYCGWILTVC